jgi:tellurium resistance protein TerD
LEEDFSVETAVQVGSLYRKDGGFGFKSVGTGYQLGLDSFVIGYGAGDALEG